MDNFSYTWTTKFSTRGDNNMKNLTPHQTNRASGNYKFTWGLQTILHPTDQQCKDYLSIFLILLTSNLTEVWADFKFSIIDNKGNKSKTLESKQPHKFVEHKDWGFNKFIKRDFLLDKSNGLIINEQYTITCEVTVFPKFNKDTFCPSPNKRLKDNNYKAPKCLLLNDLWSMFKNQKFSDVSLTVCEKEFKAHKSVLAARSPVFSAMFEHEMKENKLNQVNIPDVDPKVFEEMMRFIYTGESPNLKTMAEDLMAAADKYQLKRLKIMCGQDLCENLAVDNVAKILVLADRHNVNQLKTQAIDFISSHAKDVMETEGFKLITTSYPHLLAETFRALAIKVPAPQNLSENQDPVSTNIYASNLRGVRLSMYDSNYRNQNGYEYY